MGKTTVVIDDKLLEKAIKVTGAKSKKQAIEEGLKELVRKKNKEFNRLKNRLDALYEIPKLNKIS